MIFTAHYESRSLRACAVGCEIVLVIARFFLRRAIILLRQALDGASPRWLCIKAFGT